MKIPVAEPVIDESDIALVHEAVASGWVSSIGKYITQFEEDFARYCQTKYSVATSSGTTALHLALVTLGIGTGDEVIIPTLTFIATANAVTYTGAKPVFVDSHPDYWCLDPAAVAAAITPRTKALIPVHLYGHPCDMDAISAIAKEHGLFVIEDAAEAHGALYKGKKVGSLSDISCFSFYGNKIITTGEGGMCLTSDRQLAEKMRHLHDHGMDPQKRYWHDMVGYNYRITNIQAALGVAQLAKIDTFLGKRREIAVWYASYLSELAGKGLITLPPEMAWAGNVFWMYTVLINNSCKINRDDLINRLAGRGIDTRPLFYPMHVLPMYRTEQELPVAEQLARAGINLPSSVKLTEDQVEFVAKTIAELVT